MFGLRSPRGVLVALTLGLAAFASGGGLASPSVASAASPHQAAVIVDTGATVHRVVITFSEDSISGIDALQRAGAGPVIYAMGPGAAVCSLYGVGRDPGPNCLGGQDGDNRYWAYFHATAGTSKFTSSSIGAGAARVHDGDVEGWKFGTGVAPAFTSLASLAPPPPPPSQPPATAAPAPVGSSAPVGDGGVAPRQARRQSPFHRRHRRRPRRRRRRRPVPRPRPTPRTRRSPRNARAGLSTTRPTQTASPSARSSRVRTTRAAVVAPAGR